MTTSRLTAASSLRVPTENPRPEIQASWRRCRELGLRPDRFELPRNDVPADGHPLLRVSGALVDGIDQELHGSGVAVVLTDEDATVIARRFSDEPSRRRLDDVQLAPGFVWALDVAGTNALALASQERMPALVNGPEHFMYALKALTTACAPICDERTGQLRGAFTLVCQADVANPLLLPVARHGAREIEQSLLDHSSVHERTLTQAFLRARRRERGPLVLVGDGIVLRSAAAARLFAESDGPSLWKAAACATETHDDAPVEFVSRRGEPVLGWVEPLCEGDVLIGALIRFHARSGKAGAQPRRTVGWESLTEAELALAELVAKGSTNREVATRLFVSHHTVDTHLRHIFRKLDINSRVELARLIAAKSAQPDHLDDDTWCS